MTYEEYLQSPEWRIRAEDAKHRGRWECALCASHENLEVHHRTYVRLGRELPSDLVVLCRRCHRRHHLVWDMKIRRLIHEQQWLPFDVEVPADADFN
jgi:5-methylcytosine-specific restriction endonuclease McrA